MKMWSLKQNGILIVCLAIAREVEILIGNNLKFFIFFVCSDLFLNIFFIFYDYVWYPNHIHVILGYNISCINFQILESQ